MNDSLSSDEWVIVRAGKDPNCSHELFVVPPMPGIWREHRVCRLCNQAERHPERTLTSNDCLYEDGELWSFIRRCMSQGKDIHLDHAERTYEEYSARLDLAALERLPELQSYIVRAVVAAKPPVSKTLALARIDDLERKGRFDAADAQLFRDVINANTHETGEYVYVGNAICHDSEGDVVIDWVSERIKPEPGTVLYVRNAKPPASNQSGGSTVGRQMSSEAIAQEAPSEGISATAGPSSRDRKETFEGRGPDDAEFGTAEWRRDQKAAAPQCIFRDGCHQPQKCIAQGHCDGPLGSDAT